MQTVDFPAGFQTVSAIAEIPAGGCAGRHTHPGAETTYVLEGDIAVKIEGKPDQHLKAGQSFQIPVGADARRLHHRRNEGARHLHRREGQAARIAGAVTRSSLGLPQRIAVIARLDRAIQ